MTFPNDKPEKELCRCAQSMARVDRGVRGQCDARTDRHAAAVAKALLRRQAMALHRPPIPLRLRPHAAKRHAF